MISLCAPLSDVAVGSRGVVNVTQNPNKCTPYLRAISTKNEIISITRGYVTENSSDLSSGRRPTSKSDEFSV